MLVNGTEVIIDAPARVVNGRTFVPLRAISECMGADVRWDFTEKTAYIDISKFESGRSGVKVEKKEAIEKSVTASGNIPVLDITVNYDVISGERKGIDKINAAIKDTADFLVYWATGSYGNIDDSAVERYEKTGLYNTVTADVSVKYADEKYISYLSSVKSITNNVYPAETKQSGIFDLDSGAIVSLDKILENKDAKIHEAEEKFYELMKRNPDIYFADVKIDMDKTYYYLTEKGIVFGFEKQVIAPYSTGFVEVEVSRE